jgi:hypothetical protein
MPRDRDRTTGVMAGMLAGLHPDADPERVRVLARVAADAYLDRVGEVGTADRTRLMVSVIEEVEPELQ